MRTDIFKPTVRFRQFLILCYVVASVLTSCSTHREANSDLFAPDFGETDSHPMRPLIYYLSLSICENQTIEMTRPVNVTISQDAEIRLRVKNDTISSIKVFKGSGRVHIQEIPDYNSDEFSFTFSDYICDEQYQRFGPSLTIRIFTKNGKSDDVSIITKGGDPSIICN